MWEKWNLKEKWPWVQLVKQYCKNSQEKCCFLVKLSIYSYHLVWSFVCDEMKTTQLIMYTFSGQAFFKSQ